MPKFHYIARALVQDSGYVLLVRAKGADNTFLPGGHIDFGEGAKEALVREIDEEVGMTAEVHGFCCAVEHMWPEDLRDNHEINLVFHVEILGLSKDQQPRSQEEHIELFWAKVSQLGELNLQPYPFIRLIEKANNEHGFWGSTIEERA